MPDGFVGATSVAEAFHWFGGDPVVVAEIARVLGPGGVLAVMWNERTGPSEPPLPGAYRERMNRRLGQASWPYGNEHWRPAVEAGPFGRIHKESFVHEQVVDRETMLAAAASSSAIARLPDDERARARCTLRGACGASMAPAVARRCPLDAAAARSSRSETRRGGRSRPVEASAR